MSSVRLPGLWGMNPVVHLELHTGHLPRAREFYEDLLGWRAEQTSGYWSLGTGCGLVECDTPAPAWLPYVAVRDVAGTTERARVARRPRPPRSPRRPARLAQRRSARPTAARSPSGNPSDEFRPRPQSLLT